MCDFNITTPFDGKGTVKPQLYFELIIKFKKKFNY